jgi:Tol biopolymer transport system component/tRNA A-37 threonylcarbamoyl transferase component Bud32
MSDLLERLKSALADRYAIESEIGRGGMATVFLSRDLKHDRQVAIKVLHPRLSATVGAQRFLHEIKTVASLNHPHILPVYDSGEADGFLYYVMPYVEGDSLRDRLDREGQLPVDESVRIAVEVAGGLDYAHRKGVVHRDIKPGNILLSEGHAVIADFGIAGAIEASSEKRITSTGFGVGTPLYASPEQATAQETLDGRTDIYSLGCVLYEMLAGEPPLTGSTPQMIRARRMLETPTPLHDLRDTVPPALDEVIARALARVPADRYATASQFVQALRATLLAATPATQTSMATPGVAVTPAAVVLEPKREVAHWLLLATTAVVTAAVAAWIFALSSGSRAPSEWFKFVSSRDEATDSATGSKTGGATAVRLTQYGRVSDAALSPDGSYLAYAAAESGGGTRIVVRDVETAQHERTVAVMDEQWDLKWLPDGSGVTAFGLYIGQRATLVVPRIGGTVRTHMWYGRPRVSPDGTECLYWRLPWKHLLVDKACPAREESLPPGGNDTIPILGTYAWLWDVAYSPRGDYFAVATTTGSGNAVIKAVSRSGTDQRQVAEDAAEIRSLYWRDDGRVLYYVRNLQSGSELMRLDTSPTGEPRGKPEPLLLLGDSLSVAGISADSRRLLAVKTEVEQRIVRIWPDRTGAARVEPIPGVEGSGSYWVSPDGKWLAFLAKGDAGNDIYKIPTNGGTPKRLTTTGSVEQFAWSPDGRILAFIALWQDTRSVWFISANGGPAVRLQGSRTSRELHWAPGPLMYQIPGNRNYQVVDRLRIRVGDEYRAFTSANLENLVLAVVEGVGRPLVANDSVGWMFSPRSSPDGRWVTVAWIRPPRPGLWKISLADSDQMQVQLTSNAGEIWPDAWTLDGSAIYYQVGNEILLVPADGSGKPEVVLTLPAEPRYLCDTVQTGSRPSWVCSETASESDAWLIENFDPHMN